MNSLGWVVTDTSGNCLLFDPTSFYMLETDEDLVIPFMYDNSRYTVFRREEDLDELYSFWGTTIDEMGYIATPLIDVIGEKLANQEEVDKKD